MEALRNPIRPCGVFLHEGRRGAKILPPPGACPKLWRTYGYEWSIGGIWRGSDGVERLIFIGLAFMLVYTVLVTGRFFRRYYFARREFCARLADSTPESQRIRKNLVAELSRGVGTLKSIAAAAPFLGLAGTCYGILGGFYGLGRRAHSGIGSLLTDIAATLVTTVAGLIVAVPAVVSYNVLRTLLGKFEGCRPNLLFEGMSRPYGLAQTLPLRRRFSGLPAFALIGAPILAILIPMFMLSFRRIPVGLRVHLLKMGASDLDSAPIVVSVVATNGGGQSVVYVNSKATSWSELGNTLRSQLEVRPRWIVYVAGGSDVAWADVTNAIDVARGLHAEVVLLTATPNVGSGQMNDARGKRARGKRGRRE